MKLEQESQKETVDFNLVVDVIVQLSPAYKQTREKKHKLKQTQLPLPAEGSDTGNL